MAEQWATACYQRAMVLQREMPLALGNLLAAQHRDQRRYEHVRKTGYRPKERKFEVGDLVYLRRQPDQPRILLPPERQRAMPDAIVPPIPGQAGADAEQDRNADDNFALVHLFASFTIGS